MILQADIVAKADRSHKRRKQGERIGTCLSIKFDFGQDVFNFSRAFICQVTCKYYITTVQLNLKLNKFSNYTVPLSNALRLL